MFEDLRKLKNFLSLALVILLMLMHGSIRADTTADNDGFADQDDAAWMEDGFDEDGFGEEDVDGFSEEGGFAEVDVNLDEIDLETEADSFWSFGGYFKQGADYSYAYEDPDFSKIRSTLNLDLDLKLTDDWRGQINWNGFYDYAYTHRGRDEFTDETLETYESEAEFRDFYIEGGMTEWLRIKFGRQIIAWGQSDSAQITDVANPRDIRELGMVDLEDARVPVAATKLSFSSGSQIVDLVAIHEIRGNKMPANGSEFDVFQDLRAMGIRIDDEVIPESNGENTEYLIRYFKSFNGGDLGLVWADTFEDSVYLEFSGLEINNALPNPTLAEISLNLEPTHKRIKTYGLSANLVSGSWLFKTEIAQKTDVALQRNDTQDQIVPIVINLTASSQSSAVYDAETGIIETWSEKDTTIGMLGVEYSGIENTTVTLEAVGEKINEYEETLLADEVTSQMMLMVSYSALNETLDARLIWIHFADGNGDVYRFNLEYDLIDALNLAGGVINYEASEEEASVYNFRDNDRVFVAVKYSF